MGRSVFSAACVTLLVAVHVGASNLAPTHVVVTEPLLAKLIASGYARSETLRRLALDLESSGWTVFIIARPCPVKEATGCLLHTVGSFEGRPYLRVMVRVRERHPDVVLATVAHELQHALEVAASGAVHDTTSLIALFRKVGSSPTRMSDGIVFETKAARAIEVQVGRELRRSP